MTLKERLLEMCEKLPDPVPYDRVISCLSVMEAIGMDRVGETSSSDTEDLFLVFLSELEERSCRQGRKSGTSAKMPKEKLLALVRKLQADITLDQVIYKVQLLREIQIGIEQLDRGEGTDHDEFFGELLREDEDEKGEDRMVAASNKKSKGHRKVHRSRGAENGQGIRQTTATVRKKS